MSLGSANGPASGRAATDEGFSRMDRDRPGPGTILSAGAEARPTTIACRRSWPTKPKAGAGREPLWLVLIGHGTFDGREAKFNLRGPDRDRPRPARLDQAASASRRRHQLRSASGPFLNRLSGPDRVILTATRSGHEQNYARFGQHLAEAIANPRADLDKDGQVSLLEAFLTAGGQVEESYRAQSQLATEHALLDDNGDKLGTPAEWFQGVRATRRASRTEPPGRDPGQPVHPHPQRSRTPAPRRDPPKTGPARTLHRRPAGREGEVESEGGADAYYQQLEPLMVELAKLYRSMPPATAPKPQP